MHASAPDAAPAVSRCGIPARDLDEVLRAGAALWPVLAGGRVLVTGATGWFGTWLLDVLVAANRAYRLDLRVLALSRDPDGFGRRFPDLHTAPEIEWLAADLRAPLPAAPGPLSHAIHAATEASAQLNRSRPDLMFDTALEGTRHALDFAQRGGCGEFLLVSSGAVYGPQPAGLAALPETHAGGPDPSRAGNAYAEGKRAAEQLGAIWLARHGLRVKLARCFAFIGPHMPFESHFAIGNFIANAVARQPVVVRSDGSPRRSWLYMTDLMLWLFTILLRAEPMRAYNVGSAEGLAVGEVARRIAAQRGVPCEIQGRPGEPGDAYVPDISRAARELGLVPRVGLDQAIARTCDWRAAHS